MARLFYGAGSISVAHKLSAEEPAPLWLPPHIRELSQSVACYSLEAVATAQSHYPQLSPILVADSAADAIRAAHQRVPVFLRGSSPELLREQLADPQRMIDGVAPSLRHYGRALGAADAALVRSFFELAREHASVGSMLRSAGVSPSSARFRTKKKGLPAPRRWLTLARALHAALQLQRQPELGIVHAARTLGYPDATGLCHMTRDCFGLTPSEAGAAWGWEWLLSRWISRCWSKPLIGAL